MFKVGDKVVGNNSMSNKFNRGRHATVTSYCALTDSVNVTWSDGNTGHGLRTSKFSLAASPNSVGEIGNEIIATLTERGKQYDANGKEAERSMKKIVTAFNAITGKDLTAVEGWAFMQVLKQVRFFSNTSVPHRDSLIDNGAYALLQAEEALQ